MASVDGTQNEAYYIRLHLLLMEAQKVLRAKFDSKIKPLDLATTLKFAKSKLDKLHRDHIITNEQYKLLNPNPQSDRFDTTLLLCLLQNVCYWYPKLKVWAEKDNSKITGNSDQENIQRIRNLRNKIQHQAVASLEQQEFQNDWDILERAMVELGTSCGMNDIQNTISDIKTKTLEIVTPEMKSLRAITIEDLKEYQRDQQYYVKTKSWHLADNMLNDRHLTILTGHPGEGKTTMAADLALNRSKPDNCLKLANAHDWRKVDWSLKLFNTVIIDDIFGAGALDNSYVSAWKAYLPEIERAARQKRLNVIITSRHYIMEEALDALNNTSIFKTKEGNIIHLASNDLSHEERKEILISRVQQTNAENLILLNNIDIDECVVQSMGNINLDAVKTENYVFGFPQCANLFVHDGNIMKLGAQFFEKPEAHFKACIEQLYNANDEDMFQKFLALVIVWADQKGHLKSDDVRNPANASEHIRCVANLFGIDVNHKFMENIRSSLRSHERDFLIYIEHSGEYKFRHNVIRDMVGVVLGQPNHKMYETIELCPRDFLMSRIRLDTEETDEICVAVGKDNYLHLCKKVTELVLRKNCNAVNESDSTTSEISQEILEQVDHRYALIPIHNLDFGILKHPVFLNEQFVKKFLHVIKGDNLEQEIFREPVMKMIKHFLDYGIRMNEMTMCVPGYALYSKINVLAKALVENNLFYNEDIDPLLIAAHLGDLEIVELLLSKDAKVTGNTIHVAMHRPDLSCLKAILQHTGFDINDKGHAINGNYPIIVASKKGLSDAVKCLLEYGADPSVQNDKQLTALHKAVIYEQSEIVKELLTHNAPLEIKECKFKRTALHIAADVGALALVTILLAKGADVYVKDYRGHYPIFLAAIRGHTPTVEELLKHDRKQDQLRIKSYGKKSFIKGMSLFHIAVWKEDTKLMEMLIRERADPNLRDFFGRTALFFAIMNGCNKMIKMLLTYADKSIPQKQGYTPLHAAVFKRNATITDILAAYVDVNARDNYGRTPLHVACEKADVKIAKLLLIKYKADHRLITKRGDTLYHILRRVKLFSKRRRNAHCNRRAIEFLIRMVDPTYFECIRKQTNCAGISIDEPTHLTIKDATYLLGIFLVLKEGEHENGNSAEKDGTCGDFEYANIMVAILNAAVNSDGSAAGAIAFYGDDGYCLCSR